MKWNCIFALVVSSSTVPHVSTSPALCTFDLIGQTLSVEAANFGDRTGCTVNILAITLHQSIYSEAAVSIFGRAL